MYFATTFLALCASAAVASAGSVTFKTLDHVQRTVYFTANDGGAAPDAVNVTNAEDTTVSFPDGFIGNFYAIEDGKTNTPGMLGEVNFAGWLGLTYFDVSAIVDPSDHNNVKQMYPAKAKWPVSGCEVFPCDNCYILPDDVQTKTTFEDHIITTLGEGSVGL